MHVHRVHARPFPKEDGQRAGKQPTGPPLAQAYRDVTCESNLPLKLWIYRLNLTTVIQNRPSSSHQGVYLTQHQPRNGGFLQSGLSLHRAGRENPFKYKVSSPHPFSTKRNLSSSKKWLIPGPGQSIYKMSLNILLYQRVLKKTKSSLGVDMRTCCVDTNDCSSEL